MNGEGKMVLGGNKMDLNTMRTLGIFAENITEIESVRIKAMEMLAKEDTEKFRHVFVRIMKETRNESSVRKAAAKLLGLEIFD